MQKQGRSLCILLILSTLLCGCVSNLWTGATLLYDRHDVYKKLNDYHLLVKVNNSLYADKALKCDYCILDVVVFNGDILVAGHLPTSQLIEEARQRLFRLKEYRRLYIEISASQTRANSLEDSWITSKIRSQIFADASIDPDTFKIVTSDNVVYLMGDVKADEGKKVIHIARYTSGVRRVVTLLKYFTYETAQK